MEIKLLLAILFVSALSTFAEFRQWTDRSGNRIEAEFVGKFGKQVMLKDRKGKIYKFNPEKLSDADLLYLNPPPTAAECFKLVLAKSFQQIGPSRDMGLGQTITGDYKFSMRIEILDENALVPEGARGLVFIMVKRHNGDLEVLQKFESDIEWDASGGGRVECEVVTTSVTRNDKREIIDGETYHGYAIMLISKDGELILSQTSHGFLDDLDQIRALNVGDQFDKKLIKIEMDNES